MHANAVLLGLVHPDGGASGTPVNFLTLEALHEFVREMQPRSILVAGTPSEDHLTLQALLQRYANGAPLHGAATVRYSSMGYWRHIDDGPDCRSRSE